MIDLGDGSLLVINHEVGGPTYADVDELDERSNVAELVASSQAARLDELTSWMWQTGVVGVRQYTANGPNRPQRRFAEPYAAINIHSHANVKWLSGMAELAVVANGIYVRTRHNDYAHMRPVQGDFLAREYVPPPEVPADVLAKPTGLATDGTLDVTGDTQARWMTRVLDDNPEECRADLAYLEVWLEAIDDIDDGPTDAAVSSRHADDFSATIDEHATNQKLRAAGAKNPLENLAFRPLGYLVGRDGLGGTAPTRYAVNYRINTVPIGSLADVGSSTVPPTILIGVQNSHGHTLDTQLTAQQYADLKSGAVPHVDLTSTDNGHTHTYRITWSGTALDGQDLHETHQHSVIILQGFDGAVPFDDEKARAQTVDSTNRFRMIRDLQALQRHGNNLVTLSASRVARYEWADLDSAMELIPGMDGEGATLTETRTFKGVTYTYNSIDDPTNDIDNPSLNSAYYNRASKIVGTDASGRRDQHRGFNDPQLWVAKTSHPEVAGGWTYAIPLEILIRTPIESWNPADVALQPEGNAGLVGAGTEADPYNKATRSFWWHTPAALATPGGGGDPADTATGTNWVLGGDGNTYQMAASGMWVFSPFLNNARTRIPIYKIAQQGSHEAVDLHLLRKQLKATLTEIINGTATLGDLDWLDLYGP